MSKTVTIEVIQSAMGLCLSINDTRVAGEKPLGGGKVIHSFVIPIERIRELL